MPDRIYSVSYGGRIYDVRAPENVDPERIYAVVRAQAGGGNTPQKKELGGFWSSLFEGAQTLGLADEATAFANNPTEENRRALIAAGESKNRTVGFGEGENWAAFKQMLGGSLGQLVAPAAAGLAATPFTSPLGGLAAASATSGAQYTAQNLLRQAQEQEKAIREGRTPEETSLGKAALAATGQTALDVVGGKAFSGVAKLFPFMRPLVGEAGEKAAREAGEVLADAAEKGTISFAGGVAKGVGKGVVFEVPQEVAQQGIERWQAGLSLTDDSALGEYKQAAIGAALLGGAFGSVSGGFEALGIGEGAEGKKPGATEILGAPSADMDAVVARAFTNPEDKAAFDALVKQFVDDYGIPEDEAARLAMGAMRPTGAQAEEEAAAAGEDIAEPTLRTAVEPVTEAPAPAEVQPAAESAGVTPPSVIPPLETITPEAQVRDQLAAVTPPAPVAEVAPVAPPAAPALVEEAAPVANAIWASEEFDYPVTVLPSEPQVGPDGRSYQAVMLDGVPSFAPVDQLRPVEAPAAAPAVEPTAVEPTAEPATPAEVQPTVAETATAEEEIPAEYLAAEDAFEDASTAPPEEEVVAEPAVPVTKVAPGDAQGARPVQRGAQGVLKGRPVEGAAELTAGMQDEQVLTERLRNMRNANLISDRDAAEVLNLIRPPASAEEFNAMPESQQARWRQVLDLTRDMNEKAAQRDEATGKTKKQLNEAVKALDAQIDAVRSQLAKYAIGEAALRVEKRKAARAKVDEDFKAGKIDKAERKRQLGELRVDPLMSEALQENWFKDLDPAEAEFVQSGIEGKSFEDALQWVIDNAPNEAYRTIAKAVQANAATLKRVGWKFDFRIAHKGDPIPASMYNAMGMTRMSPSGRKAEVILHGADVTGKVGTSFETFLHEAIHAVVMPLVKAGNYKRMEPYRFSKAAQDLFDVFNHLVGEFNKKIKGGMPLTPLEEAIYKRTTNVLQKPDEILAWAMTNPEVMAYFDTVQYTPKHTIFSRIVEIIRNVLGLAKNDDSALAEILRVGETLLSTSATEAKAASEFLSELSAAATSSKQQVEANKKGSKGLHKAQLANSAAGLTEGLDEATEAVKLTAKEKRQAVYDAAVTSTLTPAKLKFQPTSWIRDAAAKMRPALGSVLNNIDKLEQGMRGMRASMERAMQRRVNQVEKFVNENGQGWLAMTMHLVRVNRVDVTAFDTREEALKNDPVLKFQEERGNAKGARKRAEEINDAWDAWEKLGEQPGGHETYKRMRQFYKDMYAALRAAQDEDIRNLGLDKEATERLIREARGDVDEDALVDEGDHKGVPENLFPAEYFPFRRFGEYVLVVQNGKRAQRERYHFETATERNMFAEKRAKELGLKRGTEEYNEAIRPFDGLENLREDLTQEGFLLAKLFSAVEEAKLPEGSSEEDAKKYRQTLKDRLYQTYLMTLPERSLRKQFIHAELVTGQSADVLRVFRVAATQYAAQLPKVVYGGRIQTQIEAAYDTLKAGDPTERQQLTYMVNTIVQRTRDAVDPQPRSWQEQLVSELTFVSLMTSIASAMVQPFTIPLQVLPRMVSRYGMGQALKMLGGYTPLLSIVEATKDVDPSTGEVTLGMPTLGNTKYIKNNPLRARLWKELDQKRDLFSQKQTDMVLRNRATSTSKGILKPGKVAEGYEKFVNWSGALFSSADQITREISGMSFAELEYNKLRAAGKSHEQAIEGAVNASVRNTNETIGNYTEAEKIDIFRGGPIRRMLGFLRTYSVQRTTYYFRMLKDIMQGSPTQTRLQAFNELSMVLTFTGLLAGVGANFGYSAITGMIDMILAAIMDDDDKEEWRKRDPLAADSADYRFRFQWLPEQFGPDSMVTRIAQRGALSELTGYDWTTRLSQSSLWIRDSRGGDTTREKIFNFAAANLSPQFSQATNILDGIDDFMNGDWSKGVAKIVPAGIRGAITAQRLATEGETTKAGLPVAGAGEFSPNELFGQVLGFTPNDLAKERERNRMKQSWKQSMKDERDKIFAEFRELRSDPEVTQEEKAALLDKIREYNRKVPLGKNGRPLSAYLIERSDLGKSVKGRETREKKSYRGVEYAPGELDLFFPYDKREPIKP